MIVNGGFEARTDVAHPSVVSTTSNTVSYDQIGEDVIMVKGVAVTGVERRSRTPHQHGVGHDLLQSSSGYKNPFQHWTHITHTTYHI